MIRERLKLPQTPWVGLWSTYLAASLLGHVAWELLQLPLYTIFRTGTLREIAFAVVHCTVGDMLIAIAVLLTAILLTSREQQLTPRRLMHLTALTILFGISYTVFSEWFNTQIQERWSYTDAMPLFPVLGIGIAPFMQWLVVPTIALVLARHCVSKRDNG